ncbi:nuclease-related domain-containing protein [Methanoregula sp. UBA64]|jgi:hypothetical protein|uniref:nuclease-related domain-containing protein n=1 Tax=Methanoregula sp. UBA64 TaxID=1915554 RepID=UPI0025F0DE84|nr:nuclease-related domain-containing protein [Methanoregula sp. UBA64]
MSHIHGISGSTKYLLNGTRPVNGKRFETLDQMQHFYDHYDEILADTRNTVARREDETIAGLGLEETRLAAELKEGITRQTRIVDKEIGEFDHMRYAADGIFSRIGFSAKYWIAVALRNHHINSPYSGLSVQLDHVRYDKRHRAEYRQAAIDRECGTVVRSYAFLKENESFLVGAQGEEYVIRELSQLPDEFHVINDVNLRFAKAIYWRKHNEYIKTCQIDHIVAGPTGIFLLETKNWKRSDIGTKSDKLIHQVQRAGLALWYFTKDYYRGNNDRPRVRSVVISLKGSSSGRYLDQYIDIVTPGRACDYIRNRQPVLSQEDVNRFIRILTRS